MEKKLSKVVFHYDDGSSKFVEGNELDKWGGMNRQVAIFCQIHNTNPDWTAVKWTEVPAEPAAETPPEEPENLVTAIG